MKNIPIILACLCAGINSQAQTFTAVGTATTISAGYNLTPSTSGTGAFQVGGIWSHTRINFEHGFTLKFDAKFDVMWGLGGDGIAVVFKKDSLLTRNNPQRNGHRFGFIRDTTSAFLDSLYSPYDSGTLDMEIDTYPNGAGCHDDALNRDHIAFCKNGRFVPITGGDAVPVLTSGSTVKDDVYRTYTLRWSLPDTLKVTVDTSVRMIVHFDPGTLWSTTERKFITFGITGATGSDYSNQSVRNISLIADPSAATMVEQHNTCLSVVPNPNNGIFSVCGTVGNMEDQVRIDVFNTLGQLVYSDNASVANGVIAKQVSIGSNVPNGMYLIRVSGKDFKQHERVLVNR